MRAISLRSFWLPVLLTTLVAAFFGALLAHRGREWDKLQAEKASLQAKLGDLEQQNARLRAQREQLLSSPEAIERVAREDYGFAAPGEKIQAVKPAPATPAAAPAPAVRPVLPAVLYERISIALPLAVFVVTAFVFALVNVFSGRRARPARQPE